MFTTGTCQARWWLLERLRRDRVSASIGVATHPQHGASADALIHAADMALLAAKSGGKGRYMLAA
jgi:GGDEF domain-containing protein